MSASADVPAGGAAATAGARPAPPRGEFHIPSLDGIRALSFLLVFVAHAGLGHVLPGGFGVTVFFFLSGYLITTLMRLEYASSGRVSLRDFYLRRALRIWPPFYSIFALALVLGLLGLLPGTVRWAPVLAQAAHYTNYWVIAHGIQGLPEGTGVYWSLAVEEHFYLVFPALFILLQRVLPGRPEWQKRVLLLLCGAVLAWRVALVLLWKAWEDRTYMGTDTRIDSILFGCALALAGNPMLDRPRLSPSVWRYVLLPLGAALVVATFAYRAPWFRETLRYTMQGIGLTPIFVVAMREPGWWPFRILNLKVLKHVGVLSYVLYLVHHVMLFFFEAQAPALHPAARAVLALAASVAISEAMHRYVERPCARLRRRLAHANAPSAPPVQAARA